MITSTMHGMKNIKLEEWNFNWLWYCVTKLTIINWKDTLYDAQNIHHTQILSLSRQSYRDKRKCISTLKFTSSQTSGKFYYHWENITRIWSRLIHFIISFIIIIIILIRCIIIITIIIIIIITEW